MSTKRGGSNPKHCGLAGGTLNCRRAEVGVVDAVAQECQADRLRADAAAEVEDRQRPIPQQPSQQAVENLTLPADAFGPVLEQQVVIAA